MIRLANEKDLDAIEQIYLDIHKVESEGEASAKPSSHSTRSLQSSGGFAFCAWTPTPKTSVQGRCTPPSATVRQALSRACLTASPT